MLLKKVWEDLQTHSLLQKGDRVLVAVSGGPDSLCLLHVLRNLAPRLQLRLIVAHLDHGLRPESCQEAEAVCNLAAAWQLPCEDMKVDVTAYRACHSISEEEAARILRYRFLLAAANKHGAAKIAVGHHQDDQAETVLFNLLRGTGIDGLAGMLPRRRIGSVELIRPLLGITRREIEVYCCEHSLQPSYDSSNLKTVHTRNRIRLELIPQLEAIYNPRLRESLARLASLAAADRAYLQERAGKIFQRLAGRKGQSLYLDRRALLKLPEAMRRRVARQALERVVPGRQISWKQVRQLLSLNASEGRSRELALPGGARAYCSYGQLIITRQPLHQKELPAPKPLQIPGKTALAGARHVITAKLCEPQALKWPPLSNQAYLDYDVTPKPLIFRTRFPGLYFFPQGASGGKKLKDFFIDQKIPRHRRDCHPLVTVGNEVVWVAGLRIAHPYRITDATKRALVLELRQESGVTSQEIKRKGDSRS